MIEEEPKVRRLHIFLIARPSESTVFGTDAVVRTDSRDNGKSHKRQLGRVSCKILDIPEGWIRTHPTAIIQSSRAQLRLVILTYVRIPIVMKASSPVVRTVAVRLGPRSFSTVSSTEIRLMLVQLTSCSTILKIPYRSERVLNCNALELVLSNNPQRLTGMKRWGSF